MLSKLGKLGRKEPPSDLTNYAAQVEQIVENFRRLSSDFQKGVQNHVLYEKRNKKLPEAQLASLLKESLDKATGEGSLFQSALQELSDLSTSLAVIRHEFESKVEKSIIDPLSRAAESNYLAVTKQRRNLNRASIDLRSAKEQLLRIQLQTSSVTSNGSTSALGCTSTGDAANISGPAGDSLTSAATATPRLNQAQNQLNEKEQEARLCKDNLLRDLYTFATQEDGYAMLLVDYLRAEESFHEQSLQLLRQCIPNLVSVINNQKPLMTFHRHLPKHLAETGRTISYVLETCIGRLDNPVLLQEQGLFRRSGPHRKTELLVKALNLMQADEELLDSCDATVVTGALKQYLSSLPEPLVTYTLAEQWAATLKKPGTPALTVIENCLETMPLEFRRNLAYVCLFLGKVTSFSDVNKMTSENLSIVMAPSLYRLLDTVSNEFPGQAVGDRSQFETLELALDFLNSNGPGIPLIDLLIRNAESLFAKDIPFLPPPSIHGVPWVGHSRSASNVSLAESKPFSTPEAAPRLSSESVEFTSHDRISITSNDDSNKGRGTPTALDGGVKKHGGLPPPLIRKKTIAPKPPIQPPPNSLSIPAPNPSRLFSVNQTVPCDAHMASTVVVVDTKPLDSHAVNDASPSVADADHRLVSQPKDDRPKRPLPPSVYHCK